MDMESANIQTILFMKVTGKMESFQAGANLHGVMDLTIKENINLERSMGTAS